MDTTNGSIFCSHENMNEDETSEWCEDCGATFYKKEKKEEPSKKNKQTYDREDW